MKNTTRRTALTREERLQNEYHRLLGKYEFELSRADELQRNVDLLQVQKADYKRQNNELHIYNKVLSTKIEELEKELAKRIEDNKLIEENFNNQLENNTKLMVLVLQQGNTMNKLSSLIK